MIRFEGRLYGLAVSSALFACSAAPAPPDPANIASLKSRFSSSTSVYAAATARSRPGTATVMHAVRHEYIVRGVFPDDLLALDAVGSAWRGVYERGVVRTGDGNGDVFAVSPETDAMALALWQEFRAGFPNTRFVPESPLDRDPVGLRGVAKLAWYRVQLPVEFANLHPIYLGFRTDTGQPQRLIVYEGAGPEVLPIRSGGVADFVVQALAWDPTIRVSNLRDPVAKPPGLPWHLFDQRHSSWPPDSELVPVLQAQRLPLTYRGRRAYDTPVWLPSGWHGVWPTLEQRPLLVTDRSSEYLYAVACDGHAGTWMMPFEYQWQTDSADPRTANLPHLLSCAETTLALPMAYGARKLDPGLEVCVDHVLTASEKTPGASRVLQSREGRHCVTHPNFGADIFKAPGTLFNLEAGALMVSVRGVITVNCQEGSEFAGKTTVSFSAGPAPVVDFSGCDGT